MALRHRAPDTDADDAGDVLTDRRGRVLARVDAPDDADVPARVVAAIVYPTEHDELAARAAVIDADPAMAHATEHQLATAVRQYLAANAARATKRQRAAHRVLAELAPVFPTEAHADDLRAAVPSISDADLVAVMAAGLPAYLATLDAGEPVLDPPDPEA